MAWRPHGRARVDANHPSAFAVCDSCSFLYNLDDLKPQRQWAGTTLQTYNILKCSRCLDKPQPQLRARILPPDPLPRINPRPENYLVAEGDPPDPPYDPAFPQGQPFVLDDSELGGGDVLV